MSIQPEALRLADRLGLIKNGSASQAVYEDIEAAEAELRRLQSQRDALLDALIKIEDGTYDTWTEGYRAQQISHSAIAKATGVQS